jgi:hypothetical protein
VPAFSVEDAVAVLFSATFVVPQVAAMAGDAEEYTPVTRPEIIRALLASRLNSLCGRVNSRFGLRSTPTSGDRLQRGKAGTYFKAKRNSGDTGGQR